MRLEESVPPLELDLWTRVLTLLLVHPLPNILGHIEHRACKTHLLNLLHGVVGVYRGSFLIQVDPVTLIDPPVSL